jgi:diguanylate cyclase (GGDEF)-like protein
MIVAERTQQLKDASLTDPLTRLRNRRFIYEVLGTDIQAFINQKQFLKNRPGKRRDLSVLQVFGLFQVDIDHFKEVNDQYGHEAGDEILRQLAELLRGSVRADDAVMRMGGEEFLAVLKKTMPEYLPLYAEKIRRLVEERPFTLPQGPILRMTISIGYAGVPVYADQPKLLSFEQTMILADMGLYAAKDRGRNKAVGVKAGSSLPSDENSILQMFGSLDYALRNKLLEIEE